MRPEAEVDLVILYPPACARAWKESFCEAMLAEITSHGRSSG
jgi:hypothetical protein